MKNSRQNEFFFLKCGFLLFFIGVFLFFSCDKEEVDSPIPGKKYQNGILVLNEGLFNLNNSSLSWINLETDEVESDVFLKENGRPLGDTGNDMIVYGGKIYIVVNISSTLEVLDKLSLKSMKQIPFQLNGVAQQPRQITTWKKKVLITSFDGYVSVVDTTSLEIEKRVKVGRNPEGIDVSNDFAYVTNSGGLDFDNPDSTLMRINLNTMQVQDTFVVGKNPGDVALDGLGNSYIVKRGKADSDASQLVKLDLMSETVIDFAIPATSLAKDENKGMYISYYDFNSGTSNVAYFDFASQQITKDNMIVSTEILTIYGAYPFKNNEFIGLDAMGFVNSGYLKRIDENGQIMKSYHVGLNPNSIIYYP